MGTLVKKRLFVVGAVLACFGLAACGEKHDTLTVSPGSAQNVTLMLDWLPNPDHVGLYQAIADGSFAQTGLNVHVEVPSNPATPLQLLDAGKVDFAISYEPELLLARNQNEPLVSVAAIVQRPLTSIVSLGSKHVTRVSQLRATRIGDAGLAYQHAYLATILDHAGIPSSAVKEINVGEDLLPAMLSGRVDATLGAYWNVEAIALAQMRKRPNVISMEQVGIPTYDELVVAVRGGMLMAHPDVVRRFVQTLGRGYEAARRDPASAVDNLVRLNPGLDPKLALASVRATLPSFFPSNPAQPWGYQDPLQWNLYGQWMLNHRLLSNPNAPVDASTNEVLAGQGI